MIGITWWDACGMHDRIREEDIKSTVGLSKNYNVGWILDEDEIRLMLCHGSCSTGEYDIMCIPVGNIIERADPCKLS